MAHSTLPAMQALTPRRFDAVDTLRGIAIVWMTLFHFCFDLNHFGWLHQDMLVDRVWTIQRSLIVSLFLFCAGFSQALALAHAGPAQRFGASFWRRWLQVACAAALVSIGSWWMFPQSFIYFGVLHGIAVMLILLRCVAGLGRGLWLLGVILLAMPGFFDLVSGVLPLPEVMNAKALNWLGLISRKPITQDYVPVLPWLGVMCWGLAAGKWVLQHRPQRLQAPLLHVALDAPLARLGRWSLSYYLLHQPVLMGLMSGVAWWLTRS